MLQSRPIQTRRNLILAGLAALVGSLLPRRGQAVHAKPMPAPIPAYMTSYRLAYEEGGSLTVEGFESVRVVFVKEDGSPSPLGEYHAKLIGPNTYAVEIPAETCCPD